jgi:hypothetical protein
VLLFEIHSLNFDFIFPTFCIFMCIPNKIIIINSLGLDFSSTVHYLFEISLYCAHKLVLMQFSPEKAAAEGIVKESITFV